MKRILSIVLATALLMTFVALGVHAEAPVDTSKTFILSEIEYVNSSACTHSNITTIDTWVEYNYYYVRVWRTDQCLDCGYMWSTWFDIPNNVWYSLKLNG